MEGEFTVMVTDELFFSPDGFPCFVMFITGDRGQLPAGVIDRVALSGDKSQSESGREDNGLTVLIDLIDGCALFVKRGIELYISRRGSEGAVASGE